LRRGLAASPEELEIIDYGARSGKSKLTAEEMYRGRVRHRTVRDVGAGASKTDRTPLLLFRLVRELKPRTCIELGTSLGLSACYQAAALKLNGEGRLVTLEGADSLASMAARNFASLGLDNVEVARGRFQDTLPGVLAANPAIDHVFIDGHHDETATIRYFELFLPRLAGTAVVVFDDIRWSKGMKRAWDAICGRPSVRVSVDLGSLGLISTVRSVPSPTVPNCRGVR
jgi:predicted O-methyltransferase YrrM